ncbi:MAG: hypothetical protein PUC68_07575 [Firmicutes bacterium]|nr:hypothetical protein [Bacillota bacterium]
MNKDKLANVLIVIGLCFMLVPILSMYFTIPYQPESHSIFRHLYYNTFEVPGNHSLRILDIIFGFLIMVIGFIVDSKK